MKRLLPILKKNYIIAKYINPLYTFLFHFYIRNRIYKKNGNEVLLMAKKALDKINIFFWLDFGTLLGVYREGKLIRNDLDIDISVFLSDYTPEIEKSMKEHGFKLIRQFEIDDKKYGLEQTYEFKGVSLDIFYYRKNNDNMCMHSFIPFPGLNWDDSIQQKNGLLTIEAYLPLNGFTQIKFLNKYFNIPFKPDEHLKWHYGENFLIPQKWDYTDLENDNKNAVYLFDKIGIYHSFE